MKNTIRFATGHFFGLCLGLVCTWVAHSAPSDAPAIEKPTAASMNIILRDDAMTYATKTVGFSVTLKMGGKSLAIPCRDKKGFAFIKQNLEEGWNPSRVQPGEDAQGQSFEFATCRTAEFDVFAWHHKQSDVYFGVSGELMRDDYKAAKTPLMIVVKTVDGNETNFICKEPFKRIPTRATKDYTEFRAAFNCEPVAKIPAKVTGIMDFLANPGQQAFYMSYRGVQLPWIPGTAENFEGVVDRLVQQIPEGEYKGIMKTGLKACEFKIERAPGKLTVTYKTLSSGRTRKIVLTPEQLRGTADGPVYKDPIRVEAVETGEMSAAEFQVGPAKDLFLTFEKRTDNEGLIARLNGPEAYCRRLVRK